MASGASPRAGAEEGERRASHGEPVPVGELLTWSQRLSAIARTGLAFTASLYEQERYEEVLKVAAEMASIAEERLAAAGHRERPRGEGELVQEWLGEVGRGVAGYVTPKVSVGALVANEAGELLLVRRSDSGVWLYPTGWADVGYSAPEMALKEVGEETGVAAEVVRLAMVLDGLRIGLSATPVYSLVFYCRATGGRLAAHPLECSEVGFFAREALPAPLAGAGSWVEHAFATIEGRTLEVLFDRPRPERAAGPAPQRLPRR